ncbi:D-sedoheptulose-7-phosphate isomerase [Methylomicrobium sp. RS1]|jgi:D-sedoheptulose 7-phosphate isomerase|uniref:D-sedoheptulose-7-phosphate isomerase n=1 Tax=Candidatus Methylomicrobium oryzae TaxID=2802053 RepID=UPI0019230D54|nr:SIS domain-containing protein [Methylomicrobium sp. RS1]MBL1263174.1 SIS domain-containing protein [Methylomicrobium sp. RS1]
MSLQERVINHFTNSIQTQQEAVVNLSELIGFASQRLVHALLNDKKIIACGNGGSANNAQLLVASLINRYERDRPSLPAIALGTGMTMLTAIANDMQYDDIFAKPLRALGQSGDILVVYTIGGHSANILKAVNSAHDKDISVIALTGQEGGSIAPLLHENDLELRVPSNSAAHVLETHLMITHCLCDLIDYQIFGG